MRVLIVDDEPLARQRLRTLLEAEPDVVLVGECEDAAAAVDAIRRHHPDLVFLDVQMPGADGFRVLQDADPDCKPAVIFVTAHDRYALQAFEVQALDYLLKPFDQERFSKALARARKFLAADRPAGGEPPADVPAPGAEDAARPLERLVIKASGRVFFLRTEEIDWIEAAGNYLRLHVGGDTHLLRETLGRMEAQLEPRQFLRIHRSIIVNVESIRELQPAFHGDYIVVLRDGTELPLSRTYRQKLQDHFGASF